MDVLLGVILVLIVIFVVPILVYSLFVKFAALSEPERKLSFMTSVLVQKIGTAVGFVAIFVLGGNSLDDNWLIYGLIWAAMFVIVEIGQAIGSEYTKKEAVAGIISELIYFPLAAFIVAKVMI